MLDLPSSSTSAACSGCDCCCNRSRETASRESSDRQAAGELLPIRSSCARSWRARMQHRRIPLGTITRPEKRQVGRPHAGVHVEHKRYSIKQKYLSSPSLLQLVLSTCMPIWGLSGMTTDTPRNRCCLNAGPRGDLAELRSLLADALAAARPAGRANDSRAEELAASAHALPFEEGKEVGLPQLQAAAELDMERQLASLRAAKRRISVASDGDEEDQKRCSLRSGMFGRSCMKTEADQASESCQHMLNVMHRMLHARECWHVVPAAHSADPLMRFLDCLTQS